MSGDHERLRRIDDHENHDEPPPKEAACFHIRWKAKYSTWKNRTILIS
jgi:hypothetical protein